MRWPPPPVARAASAGVEAIKQTTGAIHKIKESSGEATKVIGQLGSRIGEIDKILQVIDDVKAKIEQIESETEGALVALIRASAGSWFRAQLRVSGDPPQFDGFLIQPAAAPSDAEPEPLEWTTLDELAAAFDRAAQEAKAVVLTGREGKLCAGFDLKVLMGGPAAARELFLIGGEVLMKIFLFPQPVVVACTGHAIAGGALLLGVSDVRIGIDDAVGALRRNAHPQNAQRAPPGSHATGACRATVAS